MKYSQNEQQLVYNLEMLAILKQASWLGLAQVLTRVISFFYTIFLARNFGVSDFGLYIVALSYFSIISAVADFGINRFLIREIAQDRLKTSELLWNIAALRLTLTSALFALFAVVLYFFDPDKTRVSLILLATLAILPQSIGMTFDGIFVALRKLQFSAVAFFLSSFSSALIGVVLVSRGFGAIGAINALILGQLLFVITLFGMIFINQGLHFPSIKLSILKKALIGSLPYGILGVLGLIYFRVDSIILSYIKGDVEVGIYGAAYRFLEAVTVVPSVFFSSFFPVFAATVSKEKNEMKKLYFKSLQVLGILGLIALIGYVIFIPPLIEKFLPNFLSSIAVISILSLSIPFMFMQSSTISILLATERLLKKVIMLSILTLSTNIVLNLIFIPYYGYIAASWVTVTSEVLSFTVFFILLRKEILNKV